MRRPRSLAEQLSAASRPTNAYLRWRSGRRSCGRPAQRAWSAHSDYLTIIKVMYFDEPLALSTRCVPKLRTVLAVAGLFNIFSRLSGRW